MAAILPPAFLFRYEFPVRLVEELSGPDSVSEHLIEADRLPSPRELNAETEFADVRLGWNSKGFACAVEVMGKSAPLDCRFDHPTESDGLQLWIDTRNTQSIHRAGRFCHHFVFLPVGGGRGRKQPVAAQLPIARAREESPLVDSAVLGVAADVRTDGYSLRVWLPAETMHGFDPEASPKLGFYYAVRDAELGVQTLTVGDEFPYAHDPSLWSTLELVDPSRS